MGLNDTLQEYVNHLVSITRAEHYQQQLPRIHSSPKYQRTDAGWEAVPFPGCSIIAPPGGEDPVNHGFYEALAQAQQTLQASLPENFLIPLPADSLHVTLADLLWADAYRQASVKPDFAPKLQQEMASIFQAVSPQKQAPLKFQALGYMLMPRAIGVCLVPDTEAGFSRLLTLRRSIYQQESLLGLGIEQHYNLILHITLAYFGEVPAYLGSETAEKAPGQASGQASGPASGQASEIETLSRRLVELNQSAIVSLPEFVVERAELRQFDDMTTYHRQPEWPVLEF